MRTKLPVVAACILGVAWLMKDIVLRYATDTAYETRILNEIAMHEAVDNSKVIFHLENMETRLLKALQKPDSPSTDHPLLDVARTWQADLAVASRFLRQEAQPRITDVKRLLSILQEKDSHHTAYAGVAQRLEESVTVLRKRKDSLKKWVADTVKLGVQHPPKGTYDLVAENDKGSELVTKLWEQVEVVLVVLDDERKLRSQIRDSFHARVSARKNWAEFLYAFVLGLTLVATVIGIYIEYAKSTQVAANTAEKVNAARDQLLSRIDKLENELTAFSQRAPKERDK